MAACDTVTETVCLTNYTQKAKHQMPVMQHKQLWLQMLRVGGVGDWDTACAVKLHTTVTNM